MSNSTRAISAHISRYRCGELRHQSDLLNDVADLAVQLGRLSVTGRDPIDPNLAGSRLDKPVDDLHGGALAAARWSDQHKDFAGGNGQREVIDHRPRHSLVRPGCAVEFENATRGSFRAVRLGTLLKRADRLPTR